MSVPLTIPIYQALPMAPDVPVEAEVPGGQITPCTLKHPAEGLYKRNGILLPFPFHDGFQLSVVRIHVSLPVWVGENEPEKNKTEDLTVLNFGSEKEREEYEKAGRSYKSSRLTNPGYGVRYEQEEDETEIVKTSGVTVDQNVKATIERGVLPVEVTVFIRVYGPDGQLWAGSDSTPVEYLGGGGGSSTGAGHIDFDTDLTNPLELAGDRIYWMQLLIFVPTSVKSNPQIGSEGVDGQPGTTGEVTFLYDVEPVAVGK
jgi:hypothetical protein